MPKISLLIVGCGDVGSRLATQLLAKDWQVYGLRRSIERLPVGVIWVEGDLFSSQRPDQWPTGQIDYLVYSAAATEHHETGYQMAYVDGLKHTLIWLKQHSQQPRRLFFVSSSGVYEQAGGEWIDETSPANASSYSGQIMLEAERVALSSGIPASVVRLSGIYGPGREWMLEQVRKGYRVAVSPPLYGNRIHASDAAGLLAFLLNADLQGKTLDECYIGVDNEPAPLTEVIGWLRERLGVIGWAAEESVRRAGSKRCSNARAKALGWEPHYPTYRDGYAAILDEKS